MRAGERKGGGKTPAANGQRARQGTGSRLGWRLGLSGWPLMMHAPARCQPCARCRLYSMHQPAHLVGEPHIWRAKHARQTKVSELDVACGVKASSSAVAAAGGGKNFGAGATDMPQAAPPITHTSPPQQLRGSGGRGCMRRSNSNQCWQRRWRLEQRHALDRGRSSARTIGRDQHVVGLDVSVHHPSSMAGRQPFQQRLSAHQLW